MLYYQFHIGDYATSTPWMSWDEHCAYRMLLDLYYRKEQPIPLERQDVYLLTMARTKRQRAAIDLVLRHFFTETPDGWVNDRCERVLEEYRSKAERAQQAGMASVAARRARAQQPDVSGADLSMEIEQALDGRSDDAEQSLNSSSAPVEHSFNRCSTTVQPTNNQEPETHKGKHSPLTPRDGGDGSVAPPASPDFLPLGDGSGVPPADGRERPSAPGVRRGPSGRSGRPRTVDPLAWSGVRVARPEDVPEALWRDFCTLRKAKSAPVTESALEGVRREASRVGADLAQALSFMVERGHQGFIVDAFLRGRDEPHPRSRRWPPAPENFSALDYGKGGPL